MKDVKRFERNISHSAAKAKKGWVRAMMADGVEGTNGENMYLDIPDTPTTQFFLDGISYKAEA